jgi:hypothetical protein
MVHDNPPSRRPQRGIRLECLFHRVVSFRYINRAVSGEMEMVAIASKESSIDSSRIRDIHVISE